MKNSLDKKVAACNKFFFTVLSWAENSLCFFFQLKHNERVNHMFNCYTCASILELKQVDICVQTHVQILIVHLLFSLG